MGLTYNPKPDFIERMIEDAAGQFFESFSYLCQAAAATEVGEIIGISLHTLNCLDQAEWRIGRAIVLYESLMLSIAPLSVQPTAKQGLQGFDLKAFAGAIATEGTSLYARPVFEEFSKRVSAGDPVGVIDGYFGKLREAADKLKDFRAKIAEGNFDAKIGHVCLTAYAAAMTYGQYVALLNRIAKETAKA